LVQITQYALKDRKKFIENPINSFIMISKLYNHLNKLNTTQIREYLKLNYKLPTDDDMQGALLGLVKLQSTYFINVNNFKNGILNKNSSSFRSLDGLKIHFFKFYKIFDFILIF
jgi:hypothetical protein